MRSNVTGIHRIVALMLAIAWSCAGSIGLALALTEHRLSIALAALFALGYAILWLRVFAYGRLLRWSDVVLPWRMH
jgi:uncharacterized membrane protein YciS (DUF1049 family)